MAHNSLDKNKGIFYRLRLQHHNVFKSHFLHLPNDLSFLLKRVVVNSFGFWWLFAFGGFLLFDTKKKKNNHLRGIAQAEDDRLCAVKCAKGS